MIFLLALIPATGLTVAGYVALYLSQRSEGALRTFGRYLGIWAWVLAALVVLGGMFAAGHMRSHTGMWGPHAGTQCPWMEGRGPDDWERRDRMGPPPPPPSPEGSTSAPAPAAPPAAR
jgi:hypothetical protein